MRKSLAISLAGWLCLILVSLGFGDAMIGGFTIPHNPPFSAAAAAGCILLALPCFLIWLVGTTVHRMRVSSARYQASLIAAGVNAANAKPQSVPGATRPDAVQQERRGRL